MPTFPDHALALDKREQIRVDRGRFGGRHAVRKALVGLQRPVLQKLGRQWPGIGIGNDLVVVAMQQCGVRSLAELNPNFVRRAS